MRSLYESNKISKKNRKNSWNNNQFKNIGRILKKSSRQINKSVKRSEASKIKKKYLRDNRHYSGKDELYVLSNANLNIVNILNTCLHKDFYSDSSFLNNRKDKTKIINNISKLKKPTWKTEKAKELEAKNNRLNTNIYSNRSQFSSDLIIKKKIVFLQQLIAPRIFLKI